MCIRDRCIADENLVFKRVNQAFAEILGYSTEELVSKAFADFVHDDDRSKLQVSLRKRVSNERFFRFETRFRCRDGSYRLISWTTPAAESDTEVTAVFVVGSDITEQRFLQNRLLKIVDDEQQRIAMDLHDGLGQELTGLAMMAESLALNLQEKQLPDFELANKIANQLGSSQLLARNLARGLRPVEIDSNGLAPALQKLADRTSEQFDFDCLFELDGDFGTIDWDTATQLYRIAQEAVANAARHSNPTSIRISLIGNQDLLELRIQDDGIGIKNLKTSQLGIGMKSMQYRSNIISGKLAVESTPNGGTLVTCKMLFS